MIFSFFLFSIFSLGAACAPQIGAFSPKPSSASGVDKVRCAFSKSPFSKRASCFISTPQCCGVRRIWRFITSSDGSPLALAMTIDFRFGARPALCRRNEAKRFSGNIAPLGSRASARRRAIWKRDRYSTNVRWGRRSPEKRKISRYAAYDALGAMCCCNVSIIPSAQTSDFDASAPSARQSSRGIIFIARANAGADGSMVTCYQNPQFNFLPGGRGILGLLVKLGGWRKNVQFSAKRAQVERNLNRSTTQTLW